MNVRNVCALALGPLGNLQGRVRCLSLHTGIVLYWSIKDISLLKTPYNILCCLKYITFIKKSVQEFNFFDQYNDDIAYDNTTGVLEKKEETNTDKNYYNLQIDDNTAIDAESADREDIS